MRELLRMARRELAGQGRGGAVTRVPIAPAPLCLCLWCGEPATYQAPALAADVDRAAAWRRPVELGGAIDLCGPCAQQQAHERAGLTPAGA